MKALNTFNTSGELSSQKIWSSESGKHEWCKAFGVGSLLKEQPEKKMDAKCLEVCWRLEKAALCTGTSAGRAAVSTSNRAVTAEASVAIAICKWCLQGNGGTVPRSCVRDFTRIPPARTAPKGALGWKVGPSGLGHHGLHQLQGQHGAWVWESLLW